jgi:arylsulfatase A
MSRALLTFLIVLGAIAASRPNIVMIIPDDQTYSDFGFMGNSRVHSPNLDRLAEQSAVFVNGYVPTSVCSPSLATLLTGLYPHQCGIHYNHPPPGNSAFNRMATAEEYVRTRSESFEQIKAVDTLPRVLAAKGYACLQTGKFWEGHYGNAGFTHGMTVFKGVPDQLWGGNRRLASGEHVAHGNGDAGLKIGRVSMDPAYRFIDAHADQPFMIWYAPYLPHEPHNAPEQFYEPYKGRDVPEHYLDYYASCTQFDHTVGELIAYLTAKGLAENTIFVLVSDNGWTPDAKKPHKGGYRHTRRSKRSPFEDGLRTPILFRWDGRILPGKHQELVSSVDIVPTLLAAAAIDSSKLPGEDLLPALTGSAELDANRAVFGEIYPGDASSLGNPERDLAYRWVRQGAYKLIVPEGANPWGNYLKSAALYDVAGDPRETRNLIDAPKHQGTVANLRRQLDDWWPGRKKPNVVVVLADDLGYGDLGSYGARDVRTPNLDRMAAEGMLFTNFYAAASVCSPSRAALLTGRYPIRTGVTGVISANTKRALPTEEVTLAERFKALDYATAIVGKWHLGNTPDTWPLRQGFDQWFGTIGSNDMGKGRPSLEQRRAGKAGVELVEGETVIELNPDQAKLTARYTQRAVDFIAENKERHFLLYLAHNMPHTPLFASTKTAGANKRGLYGDVLAEIDASVGAVLNALKKHGIDDQTVVLFSSDNGPWLIFGDHGGSAGPLAGGKKQILEGGLRVPLIARWPGRIPAGSVCREMVSALDLAPTLMGVAGVDIESPQIDGRDVGALFTGGSLAPSQVRPFFYFWEDKIHAVRLGDWKLQLAHTDRHTPDPAAIGNSGLRGKVMTVARPQALYDLRTDPGETKDLSALHPERVRELTRLATASTRPRRKP